MQCDPERTSHFSTIWLNKNDNKKRTSRSFSILFLVMESLKIVLQCTFLVFVVLYLEIVENIDQMHKSTFSYYQLIEMSLMTSSI